MYGMTELASCHKLRCKAGVWYGAIARRHEREANSSGMTADAWGESPERPAFRAGRSVISIGVWELSVAPGCSRDHRHVRRRRRRQNRRHHHEDDPRAGALH